jgi:hypothetical protein
MDHNIHHLRLAGTVASGEKADASVNHWANVLHLLSKKYEQDLKRESDRSGRGV